MSDNFSVDCFGADRLIYVMNDISKTQYNKVQRILKNAADEILSQSQADVPVDRGDLKASGRVENVEDDIDKVAYDVIYGDGNGTDKDYDYGDYIANGYAAFVELGTTKMPSQAYLGPAFEEESQNVVQQLGDMFS